MADSFKNSRKTARLKRVVVTFVRKLEFDNQKTRARVLIFVRPLLPPSSHIYLPKDALG